MPFFAPQENIFDFLLDNKGKKAYIFWKPFHDIN